MDKNVKHTADFYRLVGWLHTNRKRVIWISAGVVTLGAIVGIYIWSKDYHETQASEALSALKPVLMSPDGVNSSSAADPYVKLANEYPATSAGARALLTAGGILFDAGKFAEAQGKFDQFLREYPENPLNTQAALGVAASLEAQGKTAEAATHYEDLVKRHSTDPTMPQAKSALARLLLLQNKPEQALHYYQELAQANNSDSWSAEAGIQAEELLTKYPNLRKQAPARPGGSSPLPVPNLTLPK